MKKTTKRILLTVSVVVFVALVFGFTYLQNDKKKDTKIVAALEERVLPFVEGNNITYFFNQDWCRVLKYKGQVASETIESTSSEDCGKGTTGSSDTKPFTNADNEIFEQVRRVLDSVTLEKFNDISPEYPITNRPEHASLGHNEIGLAFGIDCSFCRTRYVYSPNYTKLPPDIEGEIIYTPININWYKVEQDWN